MTTLAAQIAHAATWAPENVREQIRPGYFLIRLAKKGPLVPARIYWCDHEPGAPGNKLDRWPLPFLMGELLSEHVDPLGIWLGRDKQVIDKAEYRFRVAEAEWAKAHAPDDPLAKPRRPIAPLQTPLPF